ncbi:MAG: ATP-binding cassette domain-containing protein [Ruminococcaceae bacterium]|nr:ATP-binding cassette domain-containing protein [Oscillospiraceae bacterium]
MSNTKKLLSITNLKKYFPIAKSHLFQKEQLYVRANEEITIDIYSGETFGLVGESGCGKSTLGRTILQLYEQTAGSTLYYGRTIANFAPKYVAYTLKHAPAMIAKYKKMQAKADALTKECAALGDSATFFQIQSMNLAVAEAETAFQNVVKILGGFASLDDPRPGAALLLKKYGTDVKISKLNTRIYEIAHKMELCDATIQNPMLDDAKAKNTAKVVASAQKKREQLAAQKKDLEVLLQDLDQEQARNLKEIENLKQTYATNEQFAAYEAMLDEGIDLSRLKYSEMRLLRKDLQVIFQDPYSSLNPRMTVGQIIEEGLVTHGFFRHGSPHMKEYILNIMRQCGLQDYMLHRYPHQFSGGQRQRICIARALAVNPKFIVCDECVSALDVSIQSQIINLLQELKEKQNLTYLFISHDLSVVRYISDRIGVMYLGNLVELGTAETVFADPRHPYTVALLSSIPTTDMDSLKKERIILEGNIPSPIRPPEGCKFHTRCYMACDKCKRVPPPYVEVEKGHFVACHFLDKKIDENGKYLFDLPNTQKVSHRADAE